MEYVFQEEGWSQKNYDKSGRWKQSCFKREYHRQGSFWWLGSFTHHTVLGRADGGRKVSFWVFGCRLRCHKHPSDKEKIDELFDSLSSPSKHQAWSDDQPEGGENALITSLCSSGIDGTCLRETTGTRPAVVASFAPTSWFLYKDNLICRAMRLQYIPYPFVTLGDWSSSSSVCIVCVCVSNLPVTKKQVGNWCEVTYRAPSTLAVTG